MASTPMKNKRRSMAMERLNIAVARLSAKHELQTPFEVPRKTKDKDLREILLIEGIAGLLEEMLGHDAPTLENHPLVMKQKRRGIQEGQVDPNAEMQVYEGPKLEPQSSVPKRKANVAPPKTTKKEKAHDGR